MDCNFCIERMVQSTMRHLANVFKALSDETRLAMLGLLFEAGELCVCDFVEVLQITQSKASRHLRYLANAGLVDDRRAQVWVYFRLADSPDDTAKAVLEMLPDVLKTQPSEWVERLQVWQAAKSLGNHCGV